MLALIVLSIESVRYFNLHIISKSMQNTSLVNSPCLSITTSCSQSPNLKHTVIRSSENQADESEAQTEK